MQLVFSDQEFPLSIVKSLFLAGPSPRSHQFLDWRKDALSILEQLNYDGTVFIPIPKDKFYGKGDQEGWTYLGQIAWERKARQLADYKVFWVDREIVREDIDLGMPGFTTNVEFGEDLHSGNTAYGRPDTAPKCRYLDDCVVHAKQTVFKTLQGLLEFAVKELGEGSLRTNGEVYVPLFIWNTEQFQSWYTQLKAVGNRLEEAKLLFNFKIGNNVIFSYILWTNIWIESEQRFKSNELVFARKDISTVLAYYKETELLNDIKLVVVKEFRSPVNNASGFVYELPGGSSVKNDVDPQVNAQHELDEECGIIINDISRFKYVGSRQLAATLSTHKAHVYSIELNQEEFEKIQKDAQNKTCFGVNNDSEKTYLEIISLEELKNSHLDYSMLGMVYEAIYLKH